MTEERLVRLFRSGRNQAVRIPREFELDAEEAILRKQGDRLVLEPIRTGKLLSVLRELGPPEPPSQDIDEELPALDEPDL